MSYAWAVYLLVHMHFTQILHTISIGLTVTLAVWRYVAIRWVKSVALIMFGPHQLTPNWTLAESGKLNNMTENVASLFLFLCFLFSVFCFLLYSKLFPSLIHRHPNGSCANFLLAHSREAILFPFIISPILCLPTYFVFKVRETHEMDTKEHEAMYHVYFDTDSMLFRWVNVDLPN